MHGHGKGHLVPSALSGESTALDRPRQNPAQGRHSGLSEVAATGAVVAAQITSFRRRPTVWMVLLVALGVTVAAVSYHGYLHGLRSGHLPIVGFFAPRFRLAEYGSLLSVVLAFGCCLLCFDARHRDTVAGMTGVLDSRPASNTVLLLGRFVAVVGVIWLPTTILLSLGAMVVAFAQSLGWQGPALDASALTRLLVVDLLPCLMFWSGVTVLLTCVLGARWLGLATSLVLLGLHVWGTETVPHYLLQALSTLPDSSELGSDIAPPGDTLRDVLQGFGISSFGVGCVVAAGRLYPRADYVPPGRRIAVAAGLCGLGASTIAWLAIVAALEVRQRDDWLIVHQELAAAGHRGPDVTRLSGAVEIDPARGVSIDVELAAKVLEPAQRSLAFTFNPGMAIDAVAVDGQAADFQHVAGSLLVGLPDSLERREDIDVRVRATGVPHSSFAFLGSALDIDRLPAASRVRLLGGTALVFDAGYVALVPEAHWLPTSGLAVGAGVVRDRHEVFELDMTVGVPDGWLAVGPGRREVEPRAPYTYRFRPNTEIPGVAVFAAPFRTFNAKVGDVDVELALHSSHVGNAEAFSRIADPLAVRLADLLHFAGTNRIPYPHQALRIVEVPSALRTYGAGSRMALAAQSGILLLKEQGWPTARFELRAEAEAAVRQLDVHLQNDGVSNLYAGLAHNILERTRAAGEGAEALDFVLHRLVRLILGRTPARVQEATAHTFDVRTTFGTPLRDLANHLRDGHSGRVLMRFAPYADSAEVWDRALAGSLSSLDFRSEPKTATAALDLRGGALAQLLLDLLGAKEAGRLIQRLLRERNGDVYTVYHVDGLLPETGMPGVRRWLTEKGSAGFLVSEGSVSEVEDKHGDRFHVTFHVRNDEETPGWFHIKEHYDPRWPVRMGGVVRVPPASAVQVGLVVNERPGELWLHPYFSRNRGAVRIALSDAPGDRSPATRVVGSKASTWRPSEEGGVVVDDLSEGFATTDERPTFGFLRPGSDGERDDAMGLPSYRESPDHTGWSRQWAPTSWGRYRATMVRTPQGNGYKRAHFSTEVRDSGPWRLDYHVPNVQLLMLPDESIGSFEITVSADSHPPRTVVFDASVPGPGWSPVGTFDLGAGHVRVTLSDRTDGTHVIADAVRWVEIASPRLGRVPATSD